MDKIAIELSKLPFIETINSLKQEIDDYKPISKEIEDKVFQKLKLDWNYNSNAIEGNKLNYGETVAFLMHGITAKGKTLKDHLDIKGHNEAITFLLGLIKEERDVSEADIRALHEMILVEEYETDAITEDGQPTKKKIKLGTYKTTPNSVKTRTGEMHHYASVEETPVLMKELMDWYNENKTNSEIHPLVLASLFHFKFVAIHPFDDGNGRLARILMNLILLRNAYPVVVVKNEDKQNYYGVLSQADTNQYIPLIEYMGDLLQHSLNLYLRGIKGESINEDSDIDKEIALFIKGIEKDKIERRNRNEVDISDRINDSIIPTFNSLIEKLNNFEQLFFNYNYKFLIDRSWHSSYYSNTFQTSFSKDNNIESVITLIRSLLYDNRHFPMKLVFNFINLKLKRDVSITKEIKIYFLKDVYNIGYGSEEKDKLEKSYNLKITQKEINKICAKFVNELINEIK